MVTNFRGRGGFKKFLNNVCAVGPPAPSVPIPPGVNRGLCGYPGKYLPRSAGQIRDLLLGHAGSYTPARMRVRRCIVLAVTVS